MKDTYIKKKGSFYKEGYKINTSKTLIFSQFLEKNSIEQKQRKK
jgi:hypothetical protein